MAGPVPRYRYLEYALLAGPGKPNRVVAVIRVPRCGRRKYRSFVFSDESRNFLFDEDWRVVVVGMDLVMIWSSCYIVIFSCNVYRPTSLCRKKADNKLLGGFKYFLCSMFIPTLGKSSNLTVAYFSNGLVKNHRWHNRHPSHSETCTNKISAWTVQTKLSACCDTTSRGWSTYPP